MSGGTKTTVAAMPPSLCLVGDKRRRQRSTELRSCSHGFHAMRRPRIRNELTEASSELLIHARPRSLRNACAVSVRPPTAARSRRVARRATSRRRSAPGFPGPTAKATNGSPHDLRVFERARSVRTTETSTSLVFRASRLRRKSHSRSARCSRYGTLLARSRRKRSAGTADRAVDLALCVQLGRVFESY
jgi:hypothetical protein